MQSLAIIPMPITAPDGNEMPMIIAANPEQPYNRICERLLPNGSMIKPVRTIPGNSAKALINILL
jgi:hypothetical protein